MSVIHVDFTPALPTIEVHDDEEYPSMLECREQHFLQHTMAYEDSHEALIAEAEAALRPKLTIVK